MQFHQSEEQLAFAEAIDDIVEGHGGTDIARAWAADNLESGTALWAQFAELGLTGLIVPEDQGGMGGSLTDLATVMERMGAAGTPGPVVETLAFLPLIVSDEDRATLMEGALGSVAYEPHHPLALDADAAQLVYSLNAEGIAPAQTAERISSISPMRRLHSVVPQGSRTEVAPETLSRAFNTASIANTAMLIGAGERMLKDSVEYAKVREQFGKPIGEYQALKHQLADVRVALSFARPLLWSAAVSVEEGRDTADRDVSAAKVQASRAAELSARVALQVHGAIGYTLEHDLSIWYNWVPALVNTWGTPAFHRDRVALAVLGQPVSQ